MKIENRKFANESLQMKKEKTKVLVQNLYPKMPRTFRCKHTLSINSNKLFVKLLLIHKNNLKHIEFVSSEKPNLKKSPLLLLQESLTKFSFITHFNY